MPPRADGNPLWRVAFTIHLTGDRPADNAGDGVQSDLRAHAEVNDFMFQLEKGEVAGRYHFQGRLKLNVRKRKAQFISFLADVFGDFVTEASQVHVRAERDEYASTAYCCKLATREAGPWGDRNSVKRLRDGEFDAAPEYEGRDLLAIAASRRAWQRELEAILRADPDDRTIYWIHDAVGGTGKSKFIKWSHFNKLAYAIPQGKAQNIASTVVAAGPKGAYVVDIPRVTGSEESQRDLFSCLEQIKNGFVLASIYGKRAELLFEPPHVVVFSNHLPNLKLCSMDRWKIFTVPGPDSPLVEILPGQVAEFIRSLGPDETDGSGSGAGAGASASAAAAPADDIMGSVAFGLHP